MSYVSGRRKRAERHPIVVVAGEDSTDRETLRLLLESRYADLRGRLVEIGTTTGSLSAATGVVDRGEDVLAGQAALVRPGSDDRTDLGGDDVLVAAAEDGT
jgi:hypothetical protein